MPFSWDRSQEPLPPGVRGGVVQVDEGPGAIIIKVVGHPNYRGKQDEMRK